MSVTIHTPVGIARFVRCGMCAFKMAKKKKLKGVRMLSSTALVAKTSLARTLMSMCTFLEDILSAVGNMRPNIPRMVVLYRPFVSQRTGSQ